MKRRLFLLSAPAIVAAPSLMRVSTAALVVPNYRIHLDDSVGAYEAAVEKRFWSIDMYTPPLTFSQWQAKAHAGDFEVGWYQAPLAVETFANGDVLQLKTVFEGGDLRVIDVHKKSMHDKINRRK